MGPWRWTWAWAECHGKGKFCRRRGEIREGWDIPTRSEFDIAQHRGLFNPTKFRYSARYTQKTLSSSRYYAWVGISNIFLEAAVGPGSYGSVTNRWGVWWIVLTLQSLTEKVLPTCLSFVITGAWRGCGHQRRYRDRPTEGRGWLNCALLGHLCLRLVWF